MTPILWSIGIAFAGLAANHKCTIAIGWLACGITTAMVYFV